MTDKTTLITTLVGVGTPVLAALVAMLVQYFRTASAKLQLTQTQAEQARADLLRATATDAVNYAQEKGAAEKLTGEQRAKIAGDVVADKLPGLSDDDITVAVRAAVGAAPGMGESGKTAAMFPKVQS